MRKSALYRSIVATAATILLLFTLTCPVFAAETIATDTQGNTEESVSTDSSETTESDLTKGFFEEWFEKIKGGLSGLKTDLTASLTDLFNEETGVLGGITRLVNSITALFESSDSLSKALFDIDAVFLQNGGYDPQAVTALNGASGKIYRIMYPLGMGVMLVCWILNTAKCGVTSTLDVRQKNSIGQIGVSIIVGLVALGIAPKILTAMTSFSYGLCRQISSTGAFAGLISSMAQNTVIQTLVGNGILGSVLSGAVTGDGVLDALAYAIFLLVIRWVFYVNLLYISLLQALSPVFIGFAGGGSTTARFAANYAREYVKALLVPPVTIAYAALCTQIMGSTVGLILSFVLSFSSISIAGKKLDKLI